MGKSDPYVFSFYNDLLNKSDFINSPEKKIGFFGFEKENIFSMQFASTKKKFFDIKLKNWDINFFPYNITGEKFDLIVCTRVAYFCKSVIKMIEEFKKSLNPGGKILIDWGYGDHWRFKDYKIGWVKNNEHESAYFKENMLWSGFWDESLLKDLNYLKFCKWVQKKGYLDVKKAIFEETPHILFAKDIKSNFTLSTLALWEEDPQLYIGLVINEK